MIDYILVLIGGFLGAISRALISKTYNNKYPFKHLGTFLVNIVGSLLLGILINLQMNASLNLFLVLAI
jgi:fluoride exporter